MLPLWALLAAVSGVAVDGRRNECQSGGKERGQVTARDIARRKEQEENSI